VSAISRLLFDQPYEFGFFQAVRMLELMRIETDHEAAGRHLIGFDGSPQKEAVRFKSVTALYFPGAEIIQLNQSEVLSEDFALPPDMHISFMGLFGPNGVLPDHYTALIIDRVRERDYALRDFLDLFNHRLVSLFYRSWKKYHLPIQVESARLLGSKQDDFTSALKSLVGVGTKGLVQRQNICDELWTYYAGHFAHKPRSASALTSILEEVFAVPVQVNQYQGHWIALQPEQQTRMGGQFCSLGVDSIAGSRVWDVGSHFRLVLGPLAYQDFDRFLIGSEDWYRLGEVVRMYVGPELSFEVQLILKKEEVPACQMGSSDLFQPRLGLNTWGFSDVMPANAEDAVFYGQEW